jgi:hypothetical protein
MINLKGYATKRSWPILAYCTDIHLEELRYTTINLSHYSRSPGRDLKPSPPEYEAGMLTTQLGRPILNDENKMLYVYY